MDGLCKVTSNLLIYEVLLMLVALGIILLYLFLELYLLSPELPLIVLPNLIGIVYLLCNNPSLIALLVDNLVMSSFA